MNVLHLVGQDGFRAILAALGLRPTRPKLGPCRGLRTRSALALAGLVAISLALNWWGMGFGLPDIWQSDEPRYPAGAWIISYGDMNPRIHNNPPLFTHLLFIERELLRVGYRFLGSPEGLVRFRDNAGLTMLGRATVGLFTAGCVVLLFRLGAALAGRRAGLAAAALLATNFLFVRNSHFALNDIPMVFWLLLSAERSTAFMRRGRNGSLYAAACAAGLAFATKYTGGIAVLFPGVAVLARRADWSLRVAALRLAACGALFAACAVLACPYFVLDRGYYLRDFWFMLTCNEADTTFGTRGMPLWLSFVDTLLISMGWTGATLGVLGAVWLGWRRPRWAVVLLGPAIVYLLVVVLRTVAHPRYLLPVVPFLLLAFVVVAARGLRRQRRPGLWLAGLVALAAAEPAAKSIRFDWVCTQEDTRCLAKRWIEHHVPRSASILVEGNFPAVPTHPYALYVASKLPWYARQADPDYLVCDMTVREAWSREAAGAQLAMPIYRAIESYAVPVAEFSPYRPGTTPRFHLQQTDAPIVDLWDTVRPGPRIRIYQLRSPRSRPLDVQVRRSRPYTREDWIDIAREGIFPEGSLLVGSKPQLPRPSR